MLAGLIRDDERQAMAGIPGLSDIPLIGRLFAHSEKTTDQTDIILTLTPHIIRILDLTEADLRPSGSARLDRPMATCAPREPPRPPAAEDRAPAVSTAVAEKARGAPDARLAKGNGDGYG